MDDREYTAEAEVDLTFTDTLYVEYYAGERRGSFIPKSVTWRGIDVTNALEPSELDAITRKINDR